MLNDPVLSRLSPRVPLLALLPLLVCVAVLHTASAQTGAPPRPTASGAPPPHPLAGTWSWTLPGKACSETLQYRPSGTRLSTSGEEVTDADYEVTRSPGATGFYRLTETVTQTNGKRDCYGDLHGSNEGSVTRFIQFSPAQDQFIVCKAESLQACFGPLRRVP